MTKRTDHPPNRPTPAASAQPEDCPECPGNRSRGHVCKGGSQ